MPFPYDLSGWLDYDREHLPALSDTEQIDYFEARVLRVFIGPLRDLWIKTGTENATTSLLIVGMTACCGIEALGRFSGGFALGNGDRFRHFANNYMSADLQIPYDGSTRLEALWFHFRNGIAHGFAVCHGGFEGNAAYFVEKNYAGYPVLEVSPEHFITDIEQGFAAFIGVLRADCPGGRFVTFSQEFESVFIDGN